MAAQVFLAASEITVRESAGAVEAAVIRIGDLSGVAEVLWGAVGDSAMDGLDFVGGTGVVRFEPGQDRATIRVQILDDGLAEPTEVFSISLINVDGAGLLAPRTARVSLLDDEAPVAAPLAPPPLSPWNAQWEGVVRGLEQPLRMIFSPADPSVAYVAEKPGRVKAIDLATGETLETILDLGASTNMFGDRGLLDVAFHPDLAAHPYLYVFRVVDPPEVAAAPGANDAFDGGGNRFSWVSRFTLDTSDPRILRVVEGSETILLGGAGQSLADLSGAGALDYTDPAFIDAVASDRMDDRPGVFVEEIRQDFLKMDSRSHAGGSLAFAPDGSLLVSTGDGTSFDIADPRTFDVQSIHSLSGKILRIDPLTGQGLPDNPFAGPDADLSLNAAKAFQLGLRNPYATAVAPDGRVVLTDTGWFSWESIGLITQTKGGSA